MTGPIADVSVFVKSYEIEKRGHLCIFWSDTERNSHAECSCSWGERNVLGAEAAMALWRAHVSAATF